MVDVTVHRERAEKIAPDLARMCLSGGEVVAVDQFEIQPLQLVMSKFKFPLSYCIFYLMRFLIIQE